MPPWTGRVFSMWMWTLAVIFRRSRVLLDHLEGGVALGVVGFGAGDAAVVGGDFDCCLRLRDVAVTVTKSWSWRVW